MKKVFALIVGLVFVSNVFSQDDKNIRFGLSAAPSVNWYKPENKQLYETKSVGLGFAWGLDVEFKITDIASFATGLKLSYDRGSLSFKDSVGYELNSNNELLENPDPSSNTFFKLESRTYRTNYISIPMLIKMKTNEIGYFTYFGQFGLISSVKTKAFANDINKSLITKTEASKEDLDNSSDMNLFRFQLSIGGGAEYNLSGTTSLIIGINYNLGFSNVLKKESAHIIELDGSKITQNASAHNVALTVGILF